MAESRPEMASAAGRHDANDHEHDHDQDHNHDHDRPRDGRTSTDSNNDATPQTRPVPLETRSGSSQRKIQFDGTTAAAGPRAATTTSLKGPARKSEEFDRRYDGPFAMPSSAMTGRTSGTFSRAETAPPRAATIRAEAGVGATQTGATVANPTTTDPEKDAGTSSDGSVPPGRPSMAGHAVFMPEPPRINYTLRSRKLSILFWWTMIVFDSTVMPIALYFGLWYGVGPGAKEESWQRLSANAVFSIVTAAIGGASILDYFLRMWALWKKDSTCRIIGATNRWQLDWFHWNFTAAWLIIMIELVVGSVQHNPRDEPYIRILSLPLATMALVFAVELLTIDIMRYFRVPAPCRISSIPKGAQLRPGIYSLVEDICAVDGGGGLAFREALDRRYEASHVFRVMLRRLGVFWSVGSMASAVLTTILIFILSKDAAYIVGWTLPFVWAGIWTPITFWYVARKLKEEDKLWMRDAARARKQSA